jgi:inner membrane protein YidH
MPPPDMLNQHAANERTMLAWMRTGISLMGFGFAIAKFGLYLREQEIAGHVHLPRGVATSHVGSGWIGASLVAIGMLTNLFATLRFRNARNAILRGDLNPPTPFLVYAMGATTTTIGMAMIVLVLRALAE